MMQPLVWCEWCDRLWVVSGGDAKHGVVPQTTAEGGLSKDEPHEWDNLADVPIQEVRPSLQHIPSLCPTPSRLGVNVKVINSVLMDNVVVAGECVPPEVAFVLHTLNH